jgi:hypothetical protein
VPQDYDEKRFAQIENIPGEGGDEADNFEPSGEERQPERETPEPDIELPEEDEPAADDTAPEWPEGGR